MGTGGAQPSRNCGEAIRRDRESVGLPLRVLAELADMRPKALAYVEGGGGFIFCDTEERVLWVLQQLKDRAAEARHSLDLSTVESARKALPRFPRWRTHVMTHRRERRPPGPYWLEGEELSGMRRFLLGQKDYQRLSYFIHGAAERTQRERHIPAWAENRHRLSLLLATHCRSGSRRKWAHCIFMYYFFEIRTKDIAKYLGISRKAVSNIIFRLNKRAGDSHRPAGVM